MSNKKLKIEVTPEVVRQIATRKAIGASLRDLESEFGLSRPVVNRVLNSELSKSVIKGLIDGAIEAAAIDARRSLAEMVSLANTAVIENLKSYNLDAAKMVYKAIGVDAIEKTEAKQHQAITVVLPGQHLPKDIEVEHE